MRIGFASTEGGCAYYRAELPARALRALGHDVVVGGDLYLYPGGPFAIATAAGADRSAASSGWIEPDVIVLAGGWPRLGPDMISAARSHGQRVVADCDDWPWLPTTNPHYTMGGGEQKIASLRAADHVTTSTPYLAAELRRHRIDSTVCRNVIDVDRWAGVRALNIERRELLELAPTSARLALAVGYRGVLGGFHDGDVRTLAGRLPTDRVYYVHVGADPREHKSFARLAGLKPMPIEGRRAVAFDEYGPALAGIDVALIPYASRPFSAAKSNIAAMEWTAAGVPWIGAGNDELRLVDRIGATVVGCNGWRRAIDDLRDPAVRARWATRQLDGLGAYLEAEGARAAAGWTAAVLDVAPARS